MLTAATVTGALGLLCWPSHRATLRLRALLGEVDTTSWRSQCGPRPVRSRPVAVVSLVLVTLPGVLTFGVVPTGVLLALAGAVAWRWRERSRTRARVVAMAAVADAVGGIVAELRAGVQPAAAVESAAADLDAHHARAAAELRALGAAARLGCEAIAPILARADTDPVSLAVARVARGWALAHRHGLPLADVLDAVRRDVESSARFAARLRAMMAGPRASAAVLAVLPVLGIALGEAMGAHPVAVLTTSAAGQLLLVCGAALVLAGTAWCGRLTRQEALS
ncbi:type II secretion system F family protein [Haloechinothrix halophila]|uniref:type II secretion system F family protein n=1 Tax=Haloechinothrix halophila TaxID=1069073 RepID=UPI0004269EDF|nr:type II secretion system F family protein [Haloechinothrix halophila]